MTRSIAIVAVLVLCAALTSVAYALTRDEAPASHRPASDPLLRSGATRYAAYLRAESASLAGARRSGDAVAVRLHEGRLAPAAGAAPRDVDPLAAVREASRLLSLDGRNAGSADLLGVEARIAGAAIAFDAIRDALWARDKGLTGSIDERLAGVRTELARHRRHGRYVRAASLPTADRRRLAAALDAFAWRLTLAAERVARR